VTRDDPTAQRHAARRRRTRSLDDVEREDYENVIVPAFESAIAQHGKVRLVYVLVDEYEGDAVWEDIKLGVRHPASFERIAIVTDARWAGPAMKVFSVLWPGQARSFPLVELDAAERWAASRSTSSRRALRAR
jgi:hypothetical protein